MRFPGFTAEVSAYRSPRQYTAAIVSSGPGGASVRAAGVFDSVCYATCMAFCKKEVLGGVPLPSLQAVIATFVYCDRKCRAKCGDPFPELKPGFFDKPPPSKTPGFFSRPGWKAIGGTAAATLIGIGLGTLAAYEIEQHGWFAPPTPQPLTPAPAPGSSGSPATGCVAIPPNTQHSVSVSTHLGCARAEGLARVAAADFCKTKTGLCKGTCPDGTPCKPYAIRQSVVTTPAGGFIEALWTGCSSTAYFTCECGC